jgi:hypothetical protein
MLQAARNANPGGITLFSSRSANNIRANAQLLLDNAGVPTAAAFDALVARAVSVIPMGNAPKLELEPSTER